MSFRPFRAKAAWTAVGKQLEKAARENICFPRCSVLSGPKLYWALAPGKKREYVRSEGGMAGLSPTQEHLSLGPIEARTRATLCF